MTTEAIVTANSRGARPGIFDSWQKALKAMALWLAFCVLAGVPTALAFLWLIGALR